MFEDNSFMGFSDYTLEENYFEESPNYFYKGDDLLMKEIKEEDINKNLYNKELENIKTRPSLNNNFQNTLFLNDNEENKEKEKLSQTPINEDENSENLPVIKNLGRKRKNSNKKGIHNKYSEDNIIRKIKSNLLKILLKFINNFIYKEYEGNIGKGIFQKKLLKMNQKQILDSKDNKNFLVKNLGLIFSNDISGKYSSGELEFNKNLIKELLNEYDEKKRKKFTNLFDLTFLDCLLHFRGDKKIELLQGLETLEDICKKL